MELKLKNTLAILKQYNPGVLDSLRSKFPQYSAILSGDDLLGPLTPDKTAEDERIICEIELTIASLKETQKRVAPDLQKIDQRLVNAKRLRLISGTIILVTSVLLNLDKSKNIYIVITALLNFVSSCVLLIASFMETPRIGGSTNLFSIFEKMTSLSSDAEKIEFKLAMCLVTRKFDDSTVELLHKAEDLSFELRRFEGVIRGINKTQADNTFSTGLTPLATKLEH